MKYIHGSLLAVLMLLCLAGCNLPIFPAGPTLSPLDQASTLVAATLSAGGISTAAASPSTPSPAPSSPTATAKPTLYINATTAKCKNGPGADFKDVALFSSGTILDMIAKDTADGYWLVKDPGSGSSCWVETQDATPSGSFDLLPEVTPQANAAKVPGTPRSLRWDYTCTYNPGGGLSVTTNMSWLAGDSSVNGYRIYRQGNHIADLPANATTFTDTTIIAFGEQLIYGVAAFNEAGASPQTRTDHNPGPIVCQ